MNADTPIDRLILEQLAGDLLPFESIAQRDRQRIAAGFLSLGPRPSSETIPRTSAWRSPMNNSIR